MRIPRDPFYRPEVRDFEVLSEFILERLHLAFRARCYTQIIHMHGDEGRRAVPTSGINAVLHGYSLEAEGDHCGV